MDHASLEGRRDELYRAIGRALTTWSRLEFDLCLVFCNSINPGGHSNPADGAYWAILSFEAKISAVSAVVQRAFPPYLTEHEELNAAWTNLKNRLLRRNKVRNKIAHGTVVNLRWQNRVGPQVDVFFAPYYFTQTLDPIPLAEYERDNYDLRPKERMYVSDMELHITKCGEISRQLRGLVSLIEQTSKREERPESGT